MAKASAKEKVKKEAPAKAAAPEFKYGVSDLAEALGIEAPSVRVKLRAKGVEKAGKSYGWNTQAELKEVISQLKAADKEEDDEKPAKKGKAKAEKPAKASKSAKASKKSKKDEEEDEDDED